MRWVSKHIVLLTVSMISVIIFIYCFGIYILNPTFLDRILFGDPAVHYLGWAYYKHTPWQFPIGQINGYFHPFGANIGFTDSIPLIAVPLKLFRHILPDQFQYLGWWLLICFLLQGILTITLLREAGLSNAIILIICTTFFILSAPLLYRNAHPALNSHWLLLGSLWCYWMNPSSRSLNTIYCWQSLWTLVSAWIHPYLAIMVLAFSFALTSKHLFVDKVTKPLEALGFFSLQLYLLLGSWFIIGYFTLATGDTESIYGIYSANLNSLINGMGYSLFQLNFPQSEGQFEGFSYLGIGIILLIAVVLVEKWINKSRIIPFPISSLYPLLLVITGLSLFAFSHKLYLNEHLLLTAPYPSFWISLGSTFRASGRFIWPLYYLILFFLVLFAGRILQHKKWGHIILLGLLIAQFIDLYPLLQRLNDMKDKKPEWKVNLSSWSPLFSQVKEVNFYPPFKEQFFDTREECIPFVFLASKHHIPINLGPLARWNSGNTEIYTRKLQQQLVSDQLRPNVLYVVPESEAELNKELITHGQLLKGYLERYYIYAAPTSSLSLIEAFDGKGIQKEAFGIEGIKLQSLAEYVDLHQDHIMLMSVMDEATFQLDEPTYAAFDSIGANLRGLPFRGSYLLVVNRNKVVFEQISPDKVISTLFEKGSSTQSLQWTKKVSLLSAGSLSGSSQASININGREYAAGKRGINIVVLDRDFKVLEQVLFDTYESTRRSLGRSSGY